MTRKEKEQCGISKYAPVKSIVKLSEDGKAQAVYNSVKDAAECNGLKPAAICNAIKRQGKAGGMKFAYRVKSESKVVIMPKCKPMPIFQKNHLPYGGIYK